MKRLAFLLALMASPALAGSPVTPVDVNNIPLGTAGNPLVTNGNGSLTSTGYQQLTSVSTATGFTPPALTNICFIQTETVSVRFRTDGTAPTASVGQLLAVGSLLQETASLSTIKFIPTSGSTIIDVDCYK